MCASRVTRDAVISGNKSCNRSCPQPRRSAKGPGRDNAWENDMLFIMSLNFTERGIREIKDDLKRAQAAKELTKKCGCEIRQIFLTSGEYGLIQIIETANGDNIAKYALANGPIFQALA
jgi:uncharacterized protein with GYD domain